MSDRYKHTFGFGPFLVINDKAHPFFVCGRQHDLDYVQQIKTRKQADEDFGRCMDQAQKMNPDIRELNELKWKAWRLVRYLGWAPWYTRKLKRAVGWAK